MSDITFYLIPRKDGYGVYLGREKFSDAEFVGKAEISPFEMTQIVIALVASKNMAECYLVDDEGELL